MVSRSPSSFGFLCAFLCLLTAPFAAQAAAPNKPTNFTLTWAANGAIHSTWTDKSGDETGFVVAYRRSQLQQYSGYDELPAHAGSSGTVTYDDTPTDWPGCSTFYWTVFAYKGPDTAREYSAASNEITVLSPPRLTTDYAGAILGQEFSFPLTTPCLNPTFTTDALPPGLTFNPATKTITGIPTSVVRRFTFNVSITSASVTSTQTAKITVFRPVPVLVAPVNGTPLPDRSFRKNGAPLEVNLSSHFPDPDVTTATRVVYNVGTMDFVYYPSAAPLTVANFLGYVSRGDYVNTIIHRCPKGPAGQPSKFVLQGGGYKADATASKITPQPAVVNEPEITNGRGTLAMAKLGSDPDSATCEYFISLVDNAANLNNQNEGFTVFGRVAGNGMTVADSVWDLPNKNYTLINSALDECPVLAPEPAAFTPSSLVKVVSAGPVSPLSFTAASSATTVCEAAVNGSTLTLTPRAGGTADITVTATDLDNQPLPKTFKVNVEERLGDWLTAQNFPNQADATAVANPDGDTALNIMEYALMTNPQSNSPQPLPLAGSASVDSKQYLTLAFPVRKFTGPGFVYTVEAGNGLEGAWTPVWNSTQGFTHAQVAGFSDQAGHTDVIVRDTVAIAPGGKRFVRLRVADTP